MRALIAELASQRESVITNTDRVREAITESHTGLVFDLDMISQRIAGTIVESGGNLTKALETAGNSLNGAFGESMPALHGVGGILLRLQEIAFHLLQPRVFARRLIEVPVNADVSMQEYVCLSRNT